MSATSLFLATIDPDSTELDSHKPPHMEVSGSDVCDSELSDAMTLHKERMSLLDEIDADLTSKASQLSYSEEATDADDVFEREIGTLRIHLI